MEEATSGMANGADFLGSASDAGDTRSGDIRLGDCARGVRGVIVGVGRGEAEEAFATELERRLLEIGFVEGATVEILHEGFLGRDPIAVRVDDMSVALRRREANSILVRVQPAAAADLTATGKPPASTDKSP